MKINFRKSLSKVHYQSVESYVILSASQIKYVQSRAVNLIDAKFLKAIFFPFIGTLIDGLTRGDINNVNEVKIMAQLVKYQPTYHSFVTTRSLHNTKPCKDEYRYGKISSQ